MKPHLGASVLWRHPGISGLLPAIIQHVDDDDRCRICVFAGLNTEPGAQISYHLPLSQWDACSFIPERSSAPPFDGHTSDDVVERLNALFA